MLLMHSGINKALSIASPYIKNKKSVEKRASLSPKSGNPKLDKLATEIFTNNHDHSHNDMTNCDFNHGEISSFPTNLPASTPLPATRPYIFRESKQRKLKKKERFSEETSRKV